MRGILQKLFSGRWNWRGLLTVVWNELLDACAAFFGALRRGAGSLKNRDIDSFRHLFFPYPHFPEERHCIAIGCEADRSFVGKFLRFVKRPGDFPVCILSGLLPGGTNRRWIHTEG